MQSLKTRLDALTSKRASASGTLWTPLPGESEAQFVNRVTGGFPARLLSVGKVTRKPGAPLRVMGLTW